MKVAEARYTGSMRTHYRKAPSGREYNFHRYTDRSGSVSIDDAEDARWLEAQPVIEVDWTPLGKLKAKYGDAKAAIEKHLDYTDKQELVGEDGFDLDVAGNAKEETMEEALKQHVKEIDNAGER